MVRTHLCVTKRGPNVTHRRSAASLIASGAASITLNQRLRAPKVESTGQALAADRAALSGDARRVAMSFVRALGRA